MSAAAAPPPAPAPGSIRYFVLLYTPQARRATLATVLALADELGAGLERALEHELAHTRLDWWQRELSEHAAGVAQHPLLRALRAAQPSAAELDPRALLEAARLDLAEGLLNAGRGERLRGETFVLAAQALGASSLSRPQREALGTLGVLALRYERATTATPDGATGSALQEAVQRLGGAMQPTVAPLLIWALLAAARSRRRAESRGGRGSSASKSRSLLHAFADNMRAWSAARRAAQGTLRIR
jgi:hypothetical protein